MLASPHSPSYVGLSQLHSPVHVESFNAQPLRVLTHLHRPPHGGCVVLAGGMQFVNTGLQPSCGVSSGGTLQLHGGLQYHSSTSMRWNVSVAGFQYHLHRVPQMGFGVVLVVVVDGFAVVVLVVVPVQLGYTVISVAPSRHDET